MKAIRYFRKSIQNKILISFLLVMLIPTTTISVSSYLISVKILKEKVSHSFNENLYYIANSIQGELARIENLTDLIYINSDVQEAISIDIDNDADYFVQLKNVNNVISNLSLYSDYYRYITSLYIFGSNGGVYIHGSDTYKTDIHELQNSLWYKTTTELKGKVLWTGVHDNEATMAKTKRIFSLARVINETNHRNIGTIYMSLKPAIFSDILSKASPITQSRIYITDQYQNIVYPEQKVSKSLNSEGIQLPTTKNNSSFEMEVNGEPFLVSNYRIDKYDWNIVQMIPLHVLTQDNKIIFKITTFAFILSFLFSAVLWFIISRNIVRPIKQLTLTMKDVKSTDIMVKSDITSIDEIGLLSRNFNYMIDRIYALFNQVLDEEQKKKDAEIKTLQSQITPHFLYNTLNTIRWMAIIQKSDGIKEVVDALARLLRNSFKHMNTFITLREELGMIHDYVYIQQTRYRDKFQVEYEVDEALLNMKCVKLTLQPLVENAIFHGIESQEEPGLIKIKVMEESTNLRITVEDNGAGMSTDQIAKSLSQELDEYDSSRGIGIHNVNNRIKLICGDIYGLEIESEIGVYTRVHVILPLATIDE
ncbi:cache domain-containing sensor histidine kinase [Paenibacillus sp. CMAA1364]